MINIQINYIKIAPVIIISYLFSTCFAFAEIVRCEYRSYSGASTSVVLSNLGDGFEIKDDESVRVFDNREGVTPWFSVTSSSTQGVNGPGFTTYVSFDISDDTARYSFRLYDDGVCVARLDDDRYSPISAEGRY